MKDPRDTPELTGHFTLVFKGDIRKFQENPLATETPFGVPVGAGMGNAFDEIEMLKSALDLARRALLRVEKLSEEGRADISRAQGLS